MAFALTSKARQNTPALVTSVRGRKSPRDQNVVGSRPLFNESLRPHTKQPAVIQAKLKVGKANDKFEKEADRVADDVMRMPASAGSNAPANFQNAPASVQRVCSACQEKEQKIQRMPLNKITSPRIEVSSDVEARVNALKRGGQPLPESLRGSFEARFGRDFSKVRVHTDARNEVESVQARAFTRGNDIVFGPGSYAPQTAEGQRLLAHELTHVIQQDNTPSGNDVIHRTPAKQPAYQDCSESTTTIANPQNGLARALDLAQRFVNGAICKLDVDPATEDKDSSYNIAQRRHFLTPTKAQRMGLKSNFKAILDKLKPEAVRCAATDKDQAYCASSPEGGRMAAFMQGGQNVLCFNFWTLDGKCKAITLIHEAAHAIGIGMTTKHPPYRGSAEYPLGGGPAGKDETAAIRINNPDAYGYFAAHVWREIDTECRALSEIIEVKESLPAPSVPGKSKDTR